MNSTRIKTVLCAALGVMGWAGCGDEGTKVPETKVVPLNLSVAGEYQLSSPTEVPPTVLASGAANEYIGVLRLLRDDPASAFVKLLDDAGVPLVSDLFGVLPGAIKGQVTDAINDYWRTQARSGGATQSEVDRILAFAESTLVSFTLESRLSVPAGAESGAREGSHTIAAVRFDVPGGLPLSVPRASVAGATLVPGAVDARPTVMASVSPSGDAQVQIGDHSFGLAYGEFVFQALNGGVGGETLRTRFGRAFDCPAMGKAVANRCVLSVCIGHASDITAICEKGLDAAVDKIHSSLTDLNFRALRFASGTGAMWDRRSTADPPDGQVDRIDGGSWKASIDAGSGARECKSTFTGTR
jgi:hypothetical protein